MDHKRKNIVFKAPGISMNTYISPAYVGTPQTFFRMGLGTVDKDWKDVLEDFERCSTPEEFLETCTRVRGYYDIPGWTQDSDPAVKELPPDSALDCSQYESLYFISGEGGKHTELQSLAQTHPHIAAEWDYEKNAPLTPDQVSSKSLMDAFWVCTKRQHRWHSKVVSRTRHNSGCPTCFTMDRTGTARDLVSVRPDLAAEFHPTLNGDLRPSDVAIGSTKLRWWKCHICGAEWQARPDVRAKSPTSGCRDCKAAERKKSSS